MPYVPGSGAHGVIHVADVYHSENVFVNSVPVALWLAPGATGSLSMQERVLVTLSDAQLEAISASKEQAANDPNAAEVGLSNKGEVPHEGPLTLTQSNSAIAAGSTEESTTSTFAISTSSGGLFVDVAKIIDAALAEAKSGSWKETGSNPKIVNCYKTVGFAINGDSTPWCAAFTGYVLKSAGAPAFKTLSSLAYSKYGEAVPLNDKGKWRLNDVVVFSRAGGGHVGFFRGYNPQTGSVLIAGGNQADNLNEVGFKSGGMPIVYVGRGWTVPSEYDRAVTYSGSGGSVKVV